MNTFFDPKRSDLLRAGGTGGAVRGRGRKKNGIRPVRFRGEAVPGERGGFVRL